jgi:5-(carboxyamino)imidazole ribonucleotide mutase
MTAPVLITMGSDSDLPIMSKAATILTELEVESDVRVVSAHRTPEVLFEVGRTAHEQGYRVLIAGAGGAAHLPGMLAALSPLPVVGVPIKSRNSIDGWDSLLSIVQMPGGVPVATFAIGEAGAANAGLFAVSLLAAAGDSGLARQLDAFRDAKRRAIEGTVLPSPENLEAKPR